MSKAIKVEDQVYQALDLLRAKGATFSDVVESLLQLRVKTLELMSVLEGSLRSGERK